MKYDASPNAKELEDWLRDRITLHPEVIISNSYLNELRDKYTHHMVIAYLDQSD